MEQSKKISGFSKLSKRQKIRWVVENFFKDPDSVLRELKSYWHHDEDQQKILDGFSENTISNYPMPYGIAPNFVIDGETYCVPMVIEESSVVAAASAAAKYWMKRGGFKTEILGTEKVGQVHFKWYGPKSTLQALFPSIEKEIRQSISAIVANMEKRGGGVTEISLRDMTHEEPDLYQVMATFETVDSMGANFINSVLENIATTLQRFFAAQGELPPAQQEVDIIMSILSNYTPNCLVRATVSCPISELGNFPNGMDAETFARKFWTALKIAEIDPHRATTHNKGIFNGVDAVVLATGNDFRAIEACGHTFAARSGQYRSLSHCKLDDGQFTFCLELPLAVGTVGGLTSLHPIAKRSLELLGNPDGPTLMRIIAATGLAQNFAAIRSLVTTGIQQGHMKMHLLNILAHLGANEQEKEQTIRHFEDKVVSFSGVRDFVESLR